MQVGESHQTCDQAEPTPGSQHATALAETVGVVVSHFGVTARFSLSRGTDRHDSCWVSRTRGFASGKVGFTTQHLGGASEIQNLIGYPLPVIFAFTTADSSRPA